MRLTERMQLKKSAELSSLCHKGKNLYNVANYMVRQRFFRDRKWYRYYDLNRLLKQDPAYRALPIQTSQQILRLVDRNWKSFFRGLRDWQDHPEKYRCRPCIPRYKPKDGESIVLFTNQQCRIKRGCLHFPKKVLPPLKIRMTGAFQHVRILPRGDHYIVEVVYDCTPIYLDLPKNRILTIDLGLNNLVTAVNNAGLPPFVIKGGVVKSINQFYNKERARLSALKDKQGLKGQTKRLKRLTLKRNNKIRDYFHKTSRTIIGYCVDNELGTIIVGYNAGWKQKIHIGRRNNQNFVSVPFHQLIQQIQYKARLVGIEVILEEEGHTSKCSFLDQEPIRHHDTYLGRRISRGLFQASDGTLINADVNGGYNIGQKAVPNAFRADGIEGVGLHPYSMII
ncbi:MAG: IS200/IS605 family element transposase accessory protein TnpB [Candidatus Helarchaeota archaeon]|nr:IS200/IS605 family element transposase accessory protein TnpB [Candidatus Helarchaeota archaeon]